MNQQRNKSETRCGSCAPARIGARTIRDGGDHSGKVNRCIVKGGECVGYYAVLTDYDAGTDTFGVGWKQRIPAAQVDEIAIGDAIEQLIAAVEYLARALPPNDSSSSTPD